MTCVESPARRAVAPRSFTDRVAVVTGGTRGIGAAITSELVRAGAYVAAGYNRDVDAAARLRDELTTPGGSSSVHRGNVGVPGDCHPVIEEVPSAHGQVDLLVNNAGVTLDKTVRIPARARVLLHRRRRLRHQQRTVLMRA